MKEKKASFTALLNAYFRGYHAKYDVPKIFDDKLAFNFLSGEERVSIEQFMVSSLQQAGLSFPDQATALAWIMQATASPAIVLSRAPYAQDQLEKAIKKGVKQYVILGAGMDTFAFRCPELVDQLQVFEVDHPATQAFKRSRLTDLGWEIPPQLHFVPVDFTQESLTTALKNSAYDPQTPTFFSWLGVTYYLTREDVLTTLRAIASVATVGSTIVFDYLDSDAFMPQKVAPRVQGMLWSVQQVGEPMKSGFNPFGLEGDLASIGLLLNEDLSPWDIQLRYFLKRTDYYHACEHVHFACAVIK